jgi:hypothetical protein
MMRSPASPSAAELFSRARRLTARGSNAIRSDYQGGIMGANKLVSMGRRVRAALGSPLRGRVTMRAIVCVALFALAWPSDGRGYQEDYSSPTSRSSAHYDLTLALARCAGFVKADATTIADADNGTDVPPQYTFTTRLAKASVEYFHFPQDNKTLGAIEAWADGKPGASLTLTADGSTCCDDKACVTQKSGSYTCTTCCDINCKCVDAGSLQAFGIYLHALGDNYSHLACTTAGGVDHSTTLTTSGAQCSYCPLPMHDCEFGNPTPKSKCTVSMVTPAIQCNHKTTSTYDITASEAATLRKNALKGLELVRDKIYARALKSKLAQLGSKVTDEQLATFASQPKAAERVKEANAIYQTCCGGACHDGYNACMKAAGGIPSKQMQCDAGQIACIKNCGSS